MFRSAVRVYRLGVSWGYVEHLKQTRWLVADLGSASGHFGCHLGPSWAYLDVIVSYLEDIIGHLGSS